MRSVNETGDTRGAALRNAWTKNRGTVGAVANSDEDLIHLRIHAAIRVQ